jgi:predicted nucleic acid-binding protein
VATLIVLDTTVLVDQVRGFAPARDFLRGLSATPACSEVTRVELLRGIRHPELRAIDRLMAIIDWIPVDEAIARRAGELGRRYRRSHGSIGVADLVVAATAQIAEAELATSNVRDFPMFKGLRPPYRAERP